jgi:hypothetical protein
MTPNETRHNSPEARRGTPTVEFSPLCFDQGAAASSGRSALSKKHPAMELLFTDRLRQSHG